MKRIISIILLVILTFTMVSTVAMAAENNCTCSETAQTNQCGSDHCNCQAQENSAGEAMAAVLIVFLIAWVFILLILALTTLC